MGTVWQELSKDIAQTVSEVGRSIVAVDGRSGHTSSGILWRSDFVLTAAHSIRHETNIPVITGPQRLVKARLVGRDRGADVAVLKLEQTIESSEAKPAPLGATASLVVGNLTVAIARTRRGNLVASAGIIGGLMGEWQAHRTRIDQFIRPDLMLYPGFSGGALAGADGAVLGLNTSGLIRGKPITIPSSTLTRIAEEIAAKGHVDQPYIGLVMQPVQIPESLQSKAGVSAGAGLLVMHVEPGAPADAGGTLLGDILLEIDGTGFDDLSDVHEVLDRKGVGNEVQVMLLRGGQKIQTAIRIGTRPLS